MPSIFDAVRQRPTKELASDAPVCPNCGGTDLHRGDSCTTLLGGGDGTVDGDPNHVHTDYHCAECRAHFTRETQSGNVWYTGAGGRVLRGMPSCFERYVYTCPSCEADVVRRYTDLDGVLPVGVLSQKWEGGKVIRSYRIFYECEGCGRSVETDEDHWWPRPANRSTS